MNKKKGGRGACSSGQKGKFNHDRSGRGDRNNNKGGGGNDKQKKHREFDITKVKCFSYNDKCHFAPDCPEPKRERGNLAEKGDDGPALLMIVASEALCIPETVELKEIVLLNEERLKPKLR